mmetsp:Transcript_107787/g.313738  ORF Transcript_107787/g.313738 Transcript_107787/m.313738 type:complete len:234 (-) Transcript_107787:925-1626(-)
MAFSSTFLVTWNSPRSTCTASQLSRSDRPTGFCSAVHMAGPSASTAPGVGVPPGATISSRAVSTRSRMAFLLSCAPCSRSSATVRRAFGTAATSSEVITATITETARGFKLVWLSCTRLRTLRSTSLRFLLASKNLPALSTAAISSSSAALRAFHESLAPASPIFATSSSTPPASTVPISTRSEPAAATGAAAAPLAMRLGAAAATAAASKVILSRASVMALETGAASESGVA